MEYVATQDITHELVKQIYKCLKKMQSEYFLAFYFERKKENQYL